MDESKSDGIGTNAIRSPFFRDSFSETDDGSFGGGVVGLTDVPV